MISETLCCRGFGYIALFQMKTTTVLTVLVLALVLTEETVGQSWFSRIRDRVRSGTDFARQAAGGARDMYRAYR